MVKILGEKKKATKHQQFLTPPTSPHSLQEAKRTAFWGMVQANNEGSNCTETTEDETQREEEPSSSFDDSNRSQGRIATEKDEVETPQKDEIETSQRSTEEALAELKESRTRTKERSSKKKKKSKSVSESKGKPQRRSSKDATGIEEERRKKMETIISSSTTSGADADEVVKSPSKKSDKSSRRHSSSSPRKTSSPRRQRRRSSRAASVPNLMQDDKGEAAIKQAQQEDRDPTASPTEPTSPKKKKKSIWKKVNEYEAAARSVSPRRRQRLQQIGLSRAASVPELIKQADALALPSAKDKSKRKKKVRMQDENKPAEANVEASDAKQAEPADEETSPASEAASGNSPATPEADTPTPQVEPESEHTTRASNISKTNPEPLNFGTVVLAKSSDSVTCMTMDDFNFTSKRQFSKKLVNEGEEDPIQKAMAPTGHLSDAGLAQILRKDIHSSKEPVLIAGLDAIKEFASKGSKERGKVILFGAIPSILKVLETEETMTQTVFLSAVGALEKVTAKHPRNQQTACELGAIPTIAVGIRRNLQSTKLVLAACRALDSITSCMRLNDGNRRDKYEEMPTEGAMTLLASCLTNHRKDEDIVAYAVGALTNICMHRFAEMQMLADAGGVTAMQLSLKRKWKSKSRRSQLKKDLKIITSSVGIHAAIPEGDEEEDSGYDSSSTVDASRDITFYSA